MSADPYRPMRHMKYQQSWNRYSYARNDPVNRIDRLGLDDVPVDPCPQGCPGEDSVQLYGWAYYAGNGISGNGRITPHPNTAEIEIPSKASAQSVSELWDKFWNELTKCEKKVAIAHTTAFRAVYAARRAAEAAESDLRGGKQGDDDYANAVKHCAWSCIMTIKLDFSAAKAFGDAHESNPNDHCNLNTDVHSRMDLHNNEVGRTIGYNLGFSGSSKECIKRCKASGDLQRAP